MRKIIPYIASDFRKDKIWLKRAKVSKRDYHIMLALDDSESMLNGEANVKALESLATVLQALTILEVGKVSVLRFGETASLVHSFKERVSIQDGAKIIDNFKFNQKKTSLIDLLFKSRMVFGQTRISLDNEMSKLLVVISDGRGIFNEGKSRVLEDVQKARRDNIFIVFLIVDIGQEKSIMDIRFPVFDTEGNLTRIESYMENFPFSFYIILRDMKNLPGVLCDSLQQWFELLCNNKT